MYLSQVTSMVDLDRMKYFHIYVSRLKEFRAKDRSQGRRFSKFCPVGFRVCAS